MINLIKRKIKKYIGYFASDEIELRKLDKLPRYSKGNFKWGSSVILFPDAASFLFIYRELFKQHIYKFTSEKKSPLIFDCGANIGLSVIYFKELFPNARVVAFEPERTVFEYLKKNIENLRLPNIELHNKALWKSNTKIRFNNEGADASRISSLNESYVFESSYEVEAVRLSGYISEEIDLLKIDIEGAELEVLKEIENKLAFVKRIFIEYHSFENSRQNLDELLKILSENNYHYYIDTPNRLRKMPFIDKYSFLSFDFFLNIYAIKIIN
jgi:FkbM family methyltransferase